MSNLCLVKKLKGSVNNENLPIFQAIRIFIGNVAGELNFICRSGKSFTLKTADGSAKIATSKANADSDIFESEVTISSVNPNAPSRFWVKNPNCNFIISDKNNIVGFYAAGYIEGKEVYGVRFTIEGEDVKNLTNLALRPQRGMDFKGKLDNLYNLDFSTVGTIGFMPFRYSTFVDDNDFSKLGNIISLPANANFSQMLRDTNLVGSIEKFIANYRKTHPSVSSGSIAFQQMYGDAESTIITYNGSRIDVGTNTATWTWAPNATDNTNTDITNRAGNTKTIDAEGNDIVVS